jgi:hypothetical protein
MSVSRVTLATIDAAAIDALSASPPTTGVCARPHPLIRRLPSTRTWARMMRNALTARLRRPHRHPIDIEPIHFFHFDSPYSKVNGKLPDLGEKCVASLWCEQLESASPSIIPPGARITAAHNTGPARAPTPTSSTPATVVSPLLQSSRSKRYLDRTRMWYGCSLTCGYAAGAQADSCVAKTGHGLTQSRFR